MITVYKPKKKIEACVYKVTKKCKEGNQKHVTKNVNFYFS